VNEQPRQQNKTKCRIINQPPSRMTGDMQHASY